MPGIDANKPRDWLRSTAMNAIKATIRSGKLELQIPADWPDGMEVLIEPMKDLSEKIGIDESEWRDDVASLADWEAWITTIEPLEFTPEEARRIAEFDEQMREYNLEAVRCRMREGTDG
jgi:hypothetical protein